MKIQYMSDLHLEFHGPRIIGNPIFDPPVTGDVLVLAGDIDLGINGVPFIEEMSERYDAVFYVLGNHEFYGNEWYKTIAAHKEHKYPSNVHFLHYAQEPIEVDGVWFIGDMLWTDLSDKYSAILAARSMNDYVRCAFSRRTLNPHDTTNHHKLAVKQLALWMERLQGSPMVVVTHHLPHPDSIHPMYQKGDAGELNPAYYTDLRELIAQEKPTVWIHGHTHNSFDYAHEDTRIVCNPRGYWGYALNEDFDPAKVIIINEPTKTSTAHTGANP